LHQLLTIVGSIIRNTMGWLYNDETWTWRVLCDLMWSKIYCLRSEICTLDYCSIWEILINATIYLKIILFSCCHQIRIKSTSNIFKRLGNKKHEPLNVQSCLLFGRGSGCIPLIWLTRPQDLTSSNIHRLLDEWAQVTVNVESLNILLFNIVMFSISFRFLILLSKHIFKIFSQNIYVWSSFLFVSPLLLESHDIVSRHFAR
jgi:hypothetical protein